MAMSEERLIDPVKNNQEKYETYREQLTRYGKAIKYGFSYEAMLIDYAMLEDRLYSLLYHAAFIGNRQTLKLLGSGSAVRKAYQSVVCAYKRPEENETLSMSSIAHKIKMARAVMCWSVESAPAPEEGAYLAALRKRCAEMDALGLIRALDELNEWRKYRNELIHSLMNKRNESVEARIVEQTERGMQLAREIDQQVRILKKGEAVRKAARLA